MLVTLWVSNYELVASMQKKKCTKKRFDELGAKMAIVFAKHSIDKRRREIRYYFCKECNAYHTTSQERNQQSVQSDVGTDWACLKCGTTNMLDVPICQACFHPRR
jgi:RNase P subunit RPR2